MVMIVLRYLALKGSNTFSVSNTIVNEETTTTMGDCTGGCQCCDNVDLVMGTRSKLTHSTHSQRFYFRAGGGMEPRVSAVLIFGR